MSSGDVATSTPYNEQNDTVQTGDSIRLPALVCLPAEHTDYPIVVLVHGSGPLDKDETVGANTPFRDLAHGLAQRGIATLRYDKRTHVYPPTAGLTIHDETLDDALSAIALAHSYSHRVYLLGHSLGGMLAPWIGSLYSHQLQGIVMLAAPARDFGTLLTEQINFLTPSGMDEAYKSQLIAKSKQSMPQYFTTEMQNYQQVAVASHLSLPMLILQGERDYQVRMTDYNIWQQALSGKPQVICKSYPKLNHLFIAGDGEISNPTEYQIPSHISTHVLDDIAHFIEH